MKETGFYTATVRGRISLVRWLEDAPYNAQKDKAGNYFYYRLDNLSLGEIERIERELEDLEKVWLDEPTPLYEREEPHPAFAGFAALLRQPKYQKQLQCGSLQFAEPDNEECLEFCLRQIETLHFQLEQARKFSAAKEVAQIMSEVEKRGGDAYAEYKPHLQALNK